MRTLIRKLISVLLISLCLGGCAAPAQVRHEASDGNNPAALERFEATYLDLFDTVTTLKGYASDRAEFDAEAERIYQTLLTYCRRKPCKCQTDGNRSAASGRSALLRRQIRLCQTRILSAS